MTKNTRRDFILKSAAIATVVGASVVANSGAAAQDACDLANCDPFPFIGEKGSISREEFNNVAERLYGSTLDLLKSRGVRVTDELASSLQKSQYNNLSQLYEKYFNIEP